MKFLVVLLPVLCLYLQEGAALKCYSCTSATDPKCGDPKDSTLQTTECVPNIFKEGMGMLKDAAETATNLLGKIGIDTSGVSSVPDENSVFACAKAVRQDGDKKVVVRSCSVPKSENFDICAKMKANQGALVTFCETCDSDGCNSATGLAPVLMLTLVTSSLAFFLAYQ